MFSLSVKVEMAEKQEYLRVYNYNMARGKQYRAVASGRRAEAQFLVYLFIFDNKRFRKARYEK